MNWGVVIPIVAFIFTVIVILLLWYWWTTSREEQSGEGQPGGSSQISERKPSEWTSAIGVGVSTFRKVVEEVKSILPPSVSSALPSGGSRTTTPVRQTGELVEAVRLFRDLASGGLVVEIGGRRYFALSEMIDETVRRRFIGIAESVSQFATGEPPTPAAYVPPPVITTPIPSSPSYATSGATGKTESSDTGKKEEKPVVVKTIAEEIEELLQYRLTLTPEFLHRSIHIRPSHGGSIQVEIDERFYDGVSDVPDEQVRAFLQDIIKEWEARK